MGEDSYPDWEAIYRDNLDRVYRLMFAKASRKWAPLVTLTGAGGLPVAMVTVAGAVPGGVDGVGFG